MKDKVRVGWILFLLSIPSLAYADGGATLMLVIGIASLIVGLIGLALTYFGWSKPTPIPVCEEISLETAERDGDDFICTYVKDGNKFPVSLNGLKQENPDANLNGCPEKIHPTSSVVSGG